MGTNDLKRNIAAGASAGVGALAGAAASIVISQEINAAEAPEQQPVDLPETPPIQVTTPTPTPTPAPNPEPKPEPEPEPDPKPEPEPPTPPTPPEETEIKVEVIGTDTIMTTDGPVDVASIKVDDQAMLLIDVDQDHVADILAIDLNNNNKVEANEFFDITGQQVDMPQQFQEPQTNGYYAQVTDPDYTNDADVDDYLMA